MKPQIPVFCFSLLLGSGAIAPIATAQPPSNTARPAGSTVLPSGIVNPVPASGSAFSSGVIGPDANSQIPITGGFMAGDRHYNHFAVHSHQ